MEEREAIAQLQGGNIAGLETLVRRYQAQAVGAAYLISHDAALAEDIEPIRKVPQRGSK